MCNNQSIKGEEIMINTDELNEAITRLENNKSIGAVTLQKLWTISHLIHNTTAEDLPEKLERLQELNNKLYEDYPHETALLDIQLYINMLRYEFDITDPREVIHVDNGRGFVQ